MSISWIAPCRCNSATRWGSTSIDRTVAFARMEWVNWSGSQRCDAGAVRARRARAPSSRRRSSTAPARCASRGAGHSFNAGTMTEGTLISLDALDRVLDADPATAASASRAGSACTRSRASCTRAGWRCRTSATSTPSRSRARSRPARTARARSYPNLSGQVEAVELVLADGSERTIDGGDELRAARVSVGALGVIAAVTLRCVPAFRMRTLDRPEPLEDVLAAAPGARRRARPLRVLDLPARGRRAHAHARPTDDPPNRARPRPHLRRATS